MDEQGRKTKELQKLGVMFPFFWWEDKEFATDTLYFTYKDLKTKPRECLNLCLRLIALATRKNVSHEFAAQLRLIFKVFIIDVDEDFDGIDYSADWKNFHDRFSQRVHGAEHPYSDKEMDKIRNIPIIIPQSTNGKIIWNFDDPWGEFNPKITKKHRHKLEYDKNGWRKK